MDSAIRGFLTEAIASTLRTRDHYNSLVNSVGAKRMLKAVEETTGYRVAVDTIEGIAEDAQMISARPEMPVHSIRVSKKRLAESAVARINRTKGRRGNSSIR